MTSPKLPVPPKEGPLWKEVPNSQGRYLVSSQGDVYSTRKNLLLKPDLTKDGYHRYVLRLPTGKARLYSHRLVLTAFDRAPLEGEIACHRNDVGTDNRLENLYWGTPASNTQDAVRNGGHRNVKKTHCPEGHPYSESNTVLFRGYQRRCRECSRRWARKSSARRKARGLPKGDPRHGTLTGYTSYGCKCDACRDASREYRKNRKARNNDST